MPVTRRNGFLKQQRKRKKGIWKATGTFYCRDLCRLQSGFALRYAPMMDDGSFFISSFFFFFRNHGNNHSPSLALYLLCNLHLASSVQQVMSFGAEEARPYLLWNLRRSFLLLFKLNTFLEYSGFTLSGMLHMHFSNFGANR